MENIKIKRVIAFLIDMLIISLVATLLAEVNILNPNKEKYNKVYNEYVEEYLPSLENKTDVNDVLNEEYSMLTYKIAYYGLSYTITGIVLVILYFTLYPHFFNGQTIGKKLTHIKLVDENENKLSFGKLFIRSLMMPISTNIALYTSISEIINVICLFTVKKHLYLQITVTISAIMMIICYVDVFMMLFRKDDQSLHDKILRTKVIKC